TQTWTPSVTGEGVDMFCLRIRTLPPPSRFFQRTRPSARLTHHSHRSPPSATLRNTRSPQTIGVDPDHAGSFSFQATFSVFDHLNGRLISRLVPFNCGPRHCGQLSAVSGRDAM